MVWNGRTKSLEVALTMRGIDLEAALTAKDAKRVDLEVTQDVDERISRYVSQAFTIQSPDGAPVKLKYAGKSVGVREVWLYFQFPLSAESPLGYSISNRMLFGTLENQTNKIAFREGRFRDALVFDEQHPTCRLQIKSSPSTGWTPPATLESLAAVRELPNLFTMADGTRVTTVEHWKARRVEIKNIVQYYAYGHLPLRPDSVTATKTDRSRVSTLIPVRRGS